MSNTVPPSRRHSSGGRRPASAEPVRWSHQAVRADSTCARGKAAREFFNLGAIISSTFPQSNSAIFGSGIIRVGRGTVDGLVYSLKLPGFPFLKLLDEVGFRINRCAIAEARLIRS